MTKIIWTFFLFLHVQLSFKFLEKMLIWLKKLTISKVESFLMSNFDLIKYLKLCLQKNYEIGNFSATELLDIFIKDRKKAF